GLAVQPDGKLLVNTRDQGIYRLTTSGTVDTSFVSGCCWGPLLALRSDGKFLISDGYSLTRFASGGGQEAQLSLNIPGGFDPGTGAPASTRPDLSNVAAVTVQADGKIILAGEFVSFNGVKRIGLVRLNGDGGYIQFDPPTLGTGGQLRLGLNSQPGKTYILQVSSDLLHWSPSQTKIATGFGLDFSETNTAVFENRFYRITA